MTTLSKLYYVNVGPLGTFRPSGDPTFDTTPRQTELIFEDLKNKGQKHLLLYFHGGLVGASSGIKTAETVTDILLAKAAEATNQADVVHPVSFIWETDLISTITSNLSSIQKTSFFKKLVEKIIKVAGSKLGVDVNGTAGQRGIGSMTDTEIQIELQKDAPFDSYDTNKGTRAANLNTGNDRDLQDDIESMLSEEIDSDPLFNNTLIEKLSEKDMAMLNQDKVLDTKAAGQRGIVDFATLIKSGVTIIYRVIKRHLAKTDHGFYPTIVEEILREVYIADVGTWAWGKMKTKAELMWLPDEPGTTGNDIHVGRFFLEQLKKYADENKDVTIDLVGHSAGSITICYFMREYLATNIQAQIRGIFFMAPACRSELFNELIIPNKDKFKFFRMFTMSNKYECLDRCVPGIYTRSLLYMISGILEENESDAHILGMERYLTHEPPYDNNGILNSIINFMGLEKNRIVYAVTDGTATDGLRCLSEHHGGFAGEKTMTIQSILYLLNQF